MLGIRINGSLPRADVDGSRESPRTGRAQLRGGRHCQYQTANQPGTRRRRRAVRRRRRRRRRRTLPPRFAQQLLLRDPHAAVLAGLALRFRGVRRIPSLFAARSAAAALAATATAAATTATGRAYAQPGRRLRKRREQQHIRSSV